VSRPPGARTRSALVQFLGPALLIVLVGLVGTAMSASTQQDFINALINVAIVIALWVFVGNSGVISFGHISFVALGAFSAGLMTIPTGVKPEVLPTLYPFLAHHSVGNVASLALAAALGGLFALIVAVPLMRLSGLSASIATLAVLEITNNVLRYWTKIGPGATALSLVPQTTGLEQATFGALIALVVAFAYGRSRSGRLLRAAREDRPAAQSIGVHIHRHRVIAFTISGALAGLAGGLLVHQLGSIITDQVYLDLTFLTLAMLVIGGITSLWGAVVGAVVVSLLDSLFSHAVNGVHVIFFQLTLPGGADLLIFGILMTLVLLFAPNGITGGRELTLSRGRLGALARFGRRSNGDRGR
jgi:branched-chain amino acid transport system permease protein